MSERDSENRPSGAVPSSGDPASTPRVESGGEGHAAGADRDAWTFDATEVGGNRERAGEHERVVGPHRTVESGRAGAALIREPATTAAPAAGTAATGSVATAALDPRARQREARRRERDEFGGLHWGAAFFGWLVAVGIAALLTALLSAIGTAIGFTAADSTGEVTDDAGTLGIVGGVLLVLILLVAYYAGGYVAGRMSRFDGLRQGLGVWVIGVAVTLVLAAAGALLGAEYNLLSQLNLPRIPVDEGAVTIGGIIVLVAIVLGTLLAAMLGGKAGTHYHRKVDRAGEL